ncbi:hypothetical protein [Niallia sp. NCCP-28]|nr:hypothetical protein [Niallia sp. NCCP-28]GKU81219.1 hypothetical protein NCCP28_06150 [Niallia sp. NCCP-28]
MIQVYCNDENGVNKWLRENQSVEVINVQMCLTAEYGEYIMVVYKTNEDK